MRKEKKIKEEIFNLITQRPKPISLIAQILGKCYMTVYKHIGDLLIEGRISELHLSGVRMYVLPLEESNKEEESICC